MLKLNRLWTAFRREDGGSATVEFAILFPAFVGLLLSCVEMGLITVRHTMLERGLDLAVRDIRLGTGFMPKSHDELKKRICQYSGFIPDCDNNLKLEMTPVSLQNYSNLSPDADCTDQSQELRPARTFVVGKDNELMVLRACAKFHPIFKLSGLGRAMTKDGAGQAAMVATSAFVQEPR